MRTYVRQLCDIQAGLLFSQDGSPLQPGTRKLSPFLSRPIPGGVGVRLTPIGNAIGTDIASFGDTPTSNVSVPVRSLQKAPGYPLFVQMSDGKVVGKGEASWIRYESKTYAVRPAIDANMNAKAGLVMDWLVEVADRVEEMATAEPSEAIPAVPVQLYDGVITNTAPTTATREPRAVCLYPHIQSLVIKFDSAAYNANDALDKYVQNEDGIWLFEKTLFETKTAAMLAAGYGSQFIDYDVQGTGTALVDVRGSQCVYVSQNNASTDSEIWAIAEVRA